MINAAYSLVASGKQIQENLTTRVRQIGVFVNNQGENFSEIRSIFACLRGLLPEIGDISTFLEVSFDQGVQMAGMPDLQTRLPGTAQRRPESVM